MTVRIPVPEPGAVQAGAPAASTYVAAGGAAAGDLNLNGMDVLVVEDNNDASELISLVLADRGALVRVAVDFESAVNAVRKAWPDVLVSDVGLPGRDGYELMREIRRMAPAGKPPLPAIALTAFARPEDRETALQAGFDAHLGKPLDPQALVAEITRLSQPRAN
jgi:CheY-like chemotaxis protein